MWAIRPARFPLTRHTAIATGADLLTVFDVWTTLHVASPVSTVLVTLLRVAYHVLAAARCAHLLAASAALGAHHMGTMSRAAVLYALVGCVTVERALRAIVVSGITSLGT